MYDPSDQNQLYHTPLLSKIWDKSDRKNGGTIPLRIYSFHTLAADYDNNTANISVRGSVRRGQWGSLYWRFNPALSSWFWRRTGDDDEDDDDDYKDGNDNDDNDDDSNVQTEEIEV